MHGARLAKDWHLACVTSTRLPHPQKVTMTPAQALVTGVPLIVIHCAGTVFLAPAEMAEIFLRRALDAVEDGRSELVPLLHLDGLDLLLISPATAVACLYDRWTLTDLAELTTLGAVHGPGGDALLSHAGGPRLHAQNRRLGAALQPELRQEA
jgi:hypothetical protein